MVNTKKNQDLYMLNFILFTLFVIQINFVYLFSKLEAWRYRPILSLIIVFIVILTFKFRNYKIFTDIQIIYMIIFTIWIGLELYFKSMGPIYGKTKYIEFLYANLILFLFPYLINLDFNDFKKLYGFFLIIDFITLIYLVLFNLNDLLTTYNMRIELAGVNPIWLGRIFGEMFILTIFLKSSRYKLLSYILCIGLITLMVFAGSKGPFIALFISLSIIYIPKLGNKINLKKILYILILIPIFIIGIIFIFKYVVFKLFSIEYLIDRFFVSGLAQSYGDVARQNLLKFALKLFYDNPIIGQGTGSYGILFWGYDRAWYPHNIILEIACELGIIGLSIFALIISNISIRYKRYIRFNKRDKYIDLTICMTIYYFVNSLFSGDLGVANSNLFLYLGLSSIILLKYINSKGSFSV